MMEKILIELLQVTNKGRKRDFNALQDLRNEYGFDFNKPVKAVKIHASFTANSLMKDFGIDCKNDIVVCIFNRPSWFETARLCFGGSIVLPACNAFDTLHSVYSKKDFECYRKGGLWDVYIIAQDMSCTLAPKKRFKYSPTVNLNTRYVYYKEEAPRQGLIERGTKHIYENKTEAYEIDKSGYPVEMKRDALQLEARRIKAERQRKAYEEMTNTAVMIAKVRKAIEIKKIELTNRLLDCTNPRDISEVGGKITSYSGLYGCYYALEDIERTDKEKRFTSPEAFNNAIGRIYGKLSEI